MVKEIFICKDGIIIRYHKKRYVVHPFHAIHNQEMVRVSIDKEVLLVNKLCKLKGIKL